MGLQDGTLFAVEVQGVVFQEGATLRHTLAHEPHGTIEGCCFPVTFSAETISFRHQTLRSQARNLVKVAQIVEVSREALGTLVFQQTTQRNFSLS